MRKKVPTCGISALVDWSTFLHECQKFDSSLFFIGQCNETNISDGICDGSNNHLSCEYDGGDCCKPVIYVHKCEMNSTCYCHYWMRRRFSHFIEPFSYDPFTGYISSKSSSYSISNLPFKSKVILREIMREMATHFALIYFTLQENCANFSVFCLYTKWV